MITVDTGFERWARDTAARDSSSRDSAAQSGALRPLLAYEPFDKQRAFHTSPAKYRLFGGAAGPGKSKALLMEAIAQAYDHPGVNTLLLRRTFPELEQSLLLYFRRDVPRELYKTFHESKHLVEWKNGSTTRFGYCQREHDVFQYQGAEFLFIGIDELTLFTLRQWQFLTSRNRCPVPGAFPCMAAATNPGNIGHAWVKSLWIDKQPAAGMEQPEEYDPSDYDFIAARVSDNPIYAKDENYLKTLRALPSHLRRAFLDGDWDVFAGQYFDRFDTSRHVARAEQIDWKPWWPRWISIDWGFEHPAATYWHASAPPGESISPAGRPPGRTAPGAQFENRRQDAGVPGVRSGALQGASPPQRASLLDAQENQDGGFPTECVGTHNQRKTAATNSAPPRTDAGVAPTSRVITYREYVTHRTAPRELAHQIIDRSLLSDCDSEAQRIASESPSISPVGAQHAAPGEDSWRDAAHSLQSTAASPGTTAAREKIDAIYLSPDAFARRTDEASIAEQMGDVFAAAGFPRPIPADNDRIGGWMLMYQMLDAGEWLLTDNCIELIRTLPNLVRDAVRVEDIEKMDGDDPADAARYGLKSRYAARGPGASRLPYEQRLAARVTSADPTVRAIQARKAQLEESQRSRPVSFLHRRRFLP